MIRNRSTECDNGTGIVSLVSKMNYITLSSDIASTVLCTVLCTVLVLLSCITSCIVSACIVSALTIC